MLTTLVKPIITTNKTLILALVKDYEESAGTGGTVGNPYSTSLANNLVEYIVKNNVLEESILTHRLFRRWVKKYKQKNK